MGNPVTHFEIVGADPAGLQSFYREAFGWDMVAAGPSYAMVHPGGEGGINGGIGAAAKGDASRVTVYVEVDDLDSVLTSVERLGGQRLVGPMAVPNGPAIALFADPEGHVVGLTVAATIAGR